MLKKIVRYGFGIAFIGIGINSTVYYVAKGHRALIFNRIEGLKPKIVGEGFHLKLPLIHLPILFDVRTRTRSYTVSASTKDFKQVNISLDATYTPKIDRLPHIFLTTGVNFDTTVMSSVVNESVKEIIVNSLVNFSN